jgi:hypothetical protein
VHAAWRGDAELANWLFAPTKPAGELLQQRLHELAAGNPDIHS